LRSLQRRRNLRRGIDIFCNVVANFAMPLRSFAAALQSSLRP